MLVLLLAIMMTTPFVRAEDIFLHDTVFIEPEAVKVYVGENVGIAVSFRYGFELGHPPLSNFRLAGMLHFLSSFIGKASGIRQQSLLEMVT